MDHWDLAELLVAKLGLGSGSALIATGWIIHGRLPLNLRASKLESGSCSGGGQFFLFWLFKINP